MLRTRKRIGAALLAAALVLSQLGATAYAVESPAGTGLCEHHTAHDAAVCGYVEAIPGRDCEHEHTPECYTDELICGMDEDAEQTATDSDAGHTHGQACYALDCPHERGEHTTDCGYIEAVPGTPCGYFCEVCAGEPDKDSGREEPTISGNDLTAPVETGTETGKPKDTGTITVTAFDQLDEAVQFQTVPAGTKLESLTLPATLGASGYTADDASEAITIKGVTWEPDSPWDDTAEPGGYLFTPVLPAGYKLADGVELPEIDVLIGGAVTFALQGDVLTVTFASNGRGGTSMNDNDMKTAIDAVLSGDDKANVATIKLIGDVTEITGYNWRYLKEQYNSNSGWDSLTALDLSSMTNLEAIRQDTGSATGQATKLTRLTLPDSVTEIGTWTFYGGKNLTLTELPGGVTQIGNSAFRGCTGITLTELPDSVTQIGDSAFEDCTGITLTKLPSSVTQIGDFAFYGCTGLDDLTIPASVESIGSYAFYGCTNLKKVTFEGKTAPSFDEDVFGNITPPAHRVCAGGGHGLSRQLECANRCPDRDFCKQRHGRHGLGQQRNERRH